MSMDTVGTIVGFVLTLMVFSYLIGDNLLYRIAVYILVGLAAGYIAIVTVESVLLPWFRTTVGSGEPISAGIGMIPVLLATFLLLKTSSRLGQLGNLAIAFLVGVGTAVAVVGALVGTLFPLVSSTGEGFGGDIINLFLIFAGVICSLIYFQYILTRQTPDGTRVRILPTQFLSIIGQGFIVTALASLYAAAILTSLTIFSERVAFLFAQLRGG